MIRDKIKFGYHCKNLLNAVDAKIRFHDERHSYWVSEHDKAIAEAKEKGFQVKTFEVTGGARAELQLEPSLANRINESLTKGNNHKMELERYMVWKRAFDLNKECYVELDAQDIEYFGL